jgi:hypothetical protein
MAPSCRTNFARSTILSFGSEGITVMAAEYRVDLVIDGGIVQSHGCKDWDEILGWLNEYRHYGALIRHTPGRSKIEIVMEDDAETVIRGEERAAEEYNDRLVETDRYFHPPIGDC